jgi:hypothetical protein
MDQSLLDSARYKISMLSLDSRFADKYYDGTADYQMRLHSTAKNIMRIALSSVEIPNVELLFTERHGTVNFAWRPVGSSTWIDATIPAGNYTADELAAVIQTALGVGFTVVVSPTSGLMTITYSGGAFEIRGTSPVGRISERPKYWGIGYYMGFRTKEVTSDSLGVLTGTSIVLVQDAPYYLIQLEVPSSVTPLTHRLWDNGWIGAFAKVVLRDGAYTVEFDDGGNMLRKENTFLAPVNIQSIRVRIVDPFGDTVNLRDMDWSMTLEMYEVVNSRVYSAISETYGRN